MKSIASARGRRRASWRARKLVSALNKINPFLAAQVPARGPITAGGKGVADVPG